VRGSSVLYRDSAGAKGNGGSVRSCCVGGGADGRSAVGTEGRVNVFGS
jgi:hypothetical protein